MKCDMVLAGVGGQGILTIAALVGKVAMAQGLNVKQSEVHGMAQRGGSVLAHLRLSDAVIHSDLIADGTADVVLGMEPMEALRHGPALGKDGVIIANANPVVNIGDYPELAQVHEAIKVSRTTCSSMARPWPRRQAPSAPSTWFCWGRFLPSCPCRRNFSPRPSPRPSLARARKSWP